MPFDLAIGAGSPALDAILRGPAAALTAVALVGGRSARASGWSASAAVALARRWPSGRRVILIDLDVAQPALHEVAGVPNEEGVADVVEFGASLHRVAVRVDDAFALVPAGSFFGEPAALLESAEWSRLLREAVGRHETLLLYIPAEAAGMAALVERAGAVIVLAEIAEASSVREQLPRPFAVLTVIAPSGVELGAAPRATTAESVSGEPAMARLTDEEFERIRLPTEAAARGELIAELRDRQRAARMTADEAEPAVSAEVETGDAGAAPAVAYVPRGGGDAAREVRVEAAADDVTLETMVPASRPIRSRRRFRHPIVWTLVVALGAALAAGSWHYFWRDRPPEQTVPVAAPQPVTQTPEPALNAQVDDAIPYSVALEAHQNLATAFERVDALTASQPELSFYIAPLERGGTLYYHVMAGPVTDSSAAVVLRDTLVARRVKTAAAPTDVRNAPLALLIGDYSTREGAAEQIEELRRLDIPSYSVIGVAADEQPLYRVYVGGFAGPAEAEVVRQLLRAAGIRDTLVNRTRSSTP